MSSGPLSAMHTCAAVRATVPDTLGEWLGLGLTLVAGAVLIVLFGLAGQFLGRLFASVMGGARKPKRRGVAPADSGGEPSADSGGGLFRKKSDGGPMIASRLFAKKRSIDELAGYLEMSADALKSFEVGYTRREIPKKSGGMRVIQAPNAETKALQRKILRRILARLNVHEAATGFRCGRSVVDNARPHTGQAVVINMDIVDFFPATTSQRITSYFRKIGWDNEAAAHLTRLTTLDGGLPQGAPTSPVLSNLVNFGLDDRIEQIVAHRKGSYTRYADDITISFPKDYPRRIRGIVQAVERTLKSHGYQVHAGKKRITRRHRQQRVTGLVVNETVNLSRRKRRWLRAVEHRIATGGEASLTPEQLAGWRAYRKMIERG